MLPAACFWQFADYPTVIHILSWFSMATLPLITVVFSGFLIVDFPAIAKLLNYEGTFKLFKNIPEALQGKYVGIKALGVQTVVLFLLVQIFDYLKTFKYTKNNEFAPNPFSEHVSASQIDMKNEADNVRNGENEGNTLRILNVSKTYSNGFQALNQINFGVKKKEIFGLLGPNGAGKSTTFNIITGLLSRSAGNMHIMERDPG